MAADVTRGGGAENRVGNRMTDGIGVGVSGQPLVERNGDPAEDERTAGDEPMQVVAVANPHCHRTRRFDEPLSHLEILGRRDLQVAPVAIDQMHGWPACSASIASSVASDAVDASASASRSTPMRNAWGVCARKISWRGRVPTNDSLCITTLDRIGRLQRGNRRAVRDRRLDGARNQRRRNERPRGIVDHHDLRARRERTESVRHRVLAALATFDHQRVVEI